MHIDLTKDELTNKYHGLKYIINMVLLNQSSILYFLSPEIDLKSSMLKSWMSKNESKLSNLQSKTLRHLSLNFDDQAALSSFNDSVTEDNLFNIFSYYGKHKNLPNWVINKLTILAKEKNSNERISFLANILLCHYFLQDNKFDLVDSHIKYCIEYVNYNIDVSEYENMVTYIICGRYLEKTKDIFLSYAVNYYNLAEDIAVSIDDEITLASILNYMTYYYHNIDNINKSIYYSEKALSLASKIDLPVVYFNTYKILAIISNTIGDYKKASYYMKHAIDFSEKIQNFSTLESIKLKNSLGFLYYLKGSFKNALQVYLDSLKTLSHVSISSELLDEAVKTCDNLSNSFRNLGNIEKAIYFSELTIKIIIDCNLDNRINDIQTLCRQYTDLGLIYGLFCNDYPNAIKYYNLAKLNITKEDHYIKHANLMILQSYVECSTSTLHLAKTTFESSIALLKKHGESSIYVQILILSYYIYFSTKFEDLSSSYMTTAINIADKLQLKEHLNFYKRIFIDKASFSKVDFNEKDYPINLIMLLSEERRSLLLESKKSRNFELIQDFSNKISLILEQDELYSTAQKMFKKFFLSKGFIVVKHCFSKDIDILIKGEINSDIDDTEIKRYLGNFILEKNLLLNSHMKEYDIFNYPYESEELFRSMVIFYLYDDTNFNNYYFIMVYDKKSDWLFSHEDANVGLLLIKNLFLKLKTIQYTEKIRENSLIDHSTGLYNTKYMWNTLDSFIREYKLNNLNFSMTILDLNYFKRINDTFGHYAGDEALRFFAKVLKLTIDADNHIIRYGGDEFVVICPGISAKEAEKEILKTLNLCKVQPFNFNNQNIFLSFSYGVLDYNETFENGKDFFNAVDKILYQNKNKRI